MALDQETAQRIHNSLVQVIEKSIAPMFTADMRITILVSKSGDPARAVLVTSTTEQDIVATVQYLRDAPKVNITGSGAALPAADAEKAAG